MSLCQEATPGTLLWNVCPHHTLTRPPGYRLSTSFEFRRIPPPTFRVWKPAPLNEAL